MASGLFSIEVVVLAEDWEAQAIYDDLVRMFEESGLTEDRFSLTFSEWKASGVEEADEA